MAGMKKVLDELAMLVDSTKRRPATADDLARLGKVPPDLRALFRWCGNLDSVVTLEEGMDWLSVERVASEMRGLREAAGGAFPQSLVPIATDGAGNFACHDAESGAVVDWDHETRKTRKLASNLERYLRKELVARLMREKKERERLDALVKRPPLVTKPMPARPGRIARLSRVDLEKLDREGYAGGARGAVLLAGERLLLGFQNMTLVWDLGKQTEVAKAWTNASFGVACHEGTGRVLQANFGVLALSDLTTLTPVAMWRAHEDRDRILDFRIAPDGRSAVTCGGDGRIRLWDVERLEGIAREVPRVSYQASPGRPLASFDGHGDRVEWCAFAPDGKSIASGGWDKTVRVWDVTTRAVRWRDQGEDGHVTAGAFNPSGTLLATGGESGQVVVFDPTGEVVSRWRAEVYGVRSLTFATDDLLLTVGQKIALWEVSDGRLVAAIDRGARHVSVRGSLVLTTGPLGLFELRAAPSGVAGRAARDDAATTEVLRDTYASRGRLSLTLRVDRQRDGADPAALLRSIYELVSNFIESVADHPGDEQVTDDYILGVEEDLETKTDRHGNAELTFVFKDHGILCPLGARACLHWFEKTLGLVDVAGYVRRAGFSLAEPPRGKSPTSPEASTPFVYIGKVLATCEKQPDGTFVLVTDRGCKVPAWRQLSRSQRAQISKLAAEGACGCSVCEAVQELGLDAETRPAERRGAFLRKARALLALERRAAAIALLEGQLPEIEGGRERMDLCRLLGDAFLAEKRLDRAAEAFEQGLDALRRFGGDSDYEYWAHYVDCSTGAKKERILREARSWTEALTRRRPDHTEAFYFLSWFCSELEDPEAALNALARAVELDEEYARLAVQDSSFERLWKIPRFRAICPG